MSKVTQVEISFIGEIEHENDVVIDEETLEEYVENFVQSLEGIESLITPILDSVRGEIIDLDEAEE